MDKEEQITELDQIRNAAIALNGPKKALAAAFSKAMLLGMITWEDAERIMES